jgi:hypothetical protein
LLVSNETLHKGEARFKQRYVAKRLRLKYWTNANFIINVREVFYRR